MAVTRPVLDPPVTRPFLKWAGGKGQLLPAFEGFYPAPGAIGAYHEPFVGSGAVFFHVKARLRPRTAVLSDSNAELMNAFQAVRDEVEDLIVALEEHAASHSEDHFYAVRDQLPSALSSAVARAARFIYLNKTCFNGLYRVNSRGLFNVPMGRYRNPGIVDVERLRRASRELAGVDLEVGHFPAILERAQPGDFVYFDPPYVPVSSTAYFTSYTEGSFGPQEQRLLAGVFRVLADSAPAMSALRESPTITASPARASTLSRAAWKMPGLGLVTPTTQESTMASK